VLLQSLMCMFIRYLYNIRRFSILQHMPRSDNIDVNNNYHDSDDDSGSADRPTDTAADSYDNNDGHVDHNADDNHNCVVDDDDKGGDNNHARDHDGESVHKQGVSAGGKHATSVHQEGQVRRWLLSSRLNSRSKLRCESYLLQHGAGQPQALGLQRQRLRVFDVQMCIKQQR